MSASTSTGGAFASRGAGGAPLPGHFSRVSEPVSRSATRHARTPPRRAIAACAGVALALGVAACGGDDVEPTADYPVAADEICLDVAEQLVDARKEVQRSGGVDVPSESPQDAARLLELQIPIRLDGLSRLQALRPPLELVAASDEYLSLAESRVDALDQALTAAQDKDEDAYLTAQGRFERLSDKARGVGEQVGLEACAEVLPPAGQQDVLAAVEKMLTSPDSKKVCGELVTEGFAETAYGSVEKCETERGLPTAVSLELLDVAGVRATSAFVDVEVVDFFGVSKQQRIELVFVDKTWKVDHRETLEPPTDEKPKKGDEGSEPKAGGQTTGEQTTTTTGEQATTTTTGDETAADGSGSAESP